jgi:hypothetical protein
LLSAAGATETLSTDGVWWNGLTPNEKAAVMFGATSAYTRGYSYGVVEERLDSGRAMMAASDSLHWTTAQQLKVMDAITKARKTLTPRHVPDFSSKPIKAYIDGMDYFYSNHPEASKLDFSWVFACIQNTLTETCDEAAQNARPRKQ